MSSPIRPEFPKFLLQTLNHIYDIERKLTLYGDGAGVMRNVERIKDVFAGHDLFYEDPMGQTFSETRTDLEASIAGVGVDDLVVTEVIKPIIRHGKHEYSIVVQRGIVIVQTRAEPSCTNRPTALEEAGPPDAEQAAHVQANRPKGEPV